MGKFLNKQRSIGQYLLVLLKGIAMGCADAIPGVSGGTIAFITGIYEELVGSIRSFDLQALRYLLAGNMKALWQHINGTFIVFLGCGILGAIALFSRFILYALANYPVLIWSFFFGLILASAIMICRNIHQWSVSVWSCIVCGIVMGYGITVVVPAQTPTALWFVFLSGAIAICAMILPGISGSFILLLLSKYEYILMALRHFDLPVILVFSTGCASGLIAFSHLLNWTLRRYHNETIAALTGIMIGSLNKVWPWKQTIATWTSPDGQIKPLIEKNIWPTTYGDLTHQDPYLLLAIALAIAGFFLVYLIEKISTKSS